MKKKVVTIDSDNKKEVVEKTLKKLKDSDVKLISKSENESLINDSYINFPFFMPDMKDLYGPTPKSQRNRIVEPVRTEPKIQRNTLCPCGSGKKYKNCCLYKTK